MIIRNDNNSSVVFQFGHKDILITFAPYGFRLENLTEPVFDDMIESPDDYDKYIDYGQDPIDIILYDSRRKARLKKMLKTSDCFMWEGYLFDFSDSTDNDPKLGLLATIEMFERYWKDMPILAYMDAKFLGTEQFDKF